MDEYDEAVSFDDFITEIAERNKNGNAKAHDNINCSDGYDWTHTKFSLWFRDGFTAVFPRQTEVIALKYQTVHGRFVLRIQLSCYRSPPSPG